MHRRSFLAASLFSILAVEASAANKRFVFKIRTKTGGIVGNIVIEAKDIEAAKFKLMKRYPGCEILEGREKQYTRRDPIVSAPADSSTQTEWA